MRFLKWKRRLRKRRARKPGAAVLVPAVFLCMLLVGCGWGHTSDLAPDLSLGKKPGGSEEKEKLRVVTTIFPYYDFVRQIAGEDVELTLVVPAGMDSHSFEPTPADMRRIQAADVLIYNGGAMEQWVTDVLGAIDTSGMTVAAMMDYVDVVEEEIVEGMEDEAHGHDHVHGPELEDRGHNDNPEPDEDEHNAGPELEDRDHNDDLEPNEADHNAGPEPDDHDHVPEYDEHIWTSPVNAMKLVSVMCDTLAAADPAHEAGYRQRTEAYLEELRRLDVGFREVSDARVRNMIVVGDKFPFRYLAEEYELDYRAAFSGCSTDTEPSARTIAYLIDRVRGENIPVVYYLELSSHRVSEIIGEETGAKPLLLHSCHNVTRTELDGGITYVELMERNIENLRKGLDE